MRIPDEVRARVWLLSEEGHSYRAIARTLGMSTRSVGRILGEDTDRLREIHQAQIQERVSLWLRLESQGLQALNDFITLARQSLVDERTGRPRKRLTKADEKLLTYGARWSQVFRLTADSASRQSQNLGGRIEDAVDAARASAAEEIGDDELIRLAIEEDMVDKLPGTLKKRAEQIIARDSD